MKKVICLMICICCVLFLSACKKEETPTKETLDLSYYAKLGQIPEVEVTLGEDVDKVIGDLNDAKAKAEAEHQEDPNHSHGHEEEEFYFEVVEGENNVLLDNGNTCYYYNKANKDKGISYIVNYDDSFGFPLGTVILEVKDKITGAKLKEEPLTEENAFFASFVLDGTVLKAEFKNTTILFVFQENELFATAIYNNNWIS